MTTKAKTSATRRSADWRAGSMVRRSNMAPPGRFAAQPRFSFWLQSCRRLHSPAKRSNNQEMRLRPLTDPEEITLRAHDVVIGGVLAIGTAIACVSYFTLIAAARAPPS